METSSVSRKTIKKTGTENTSTTILTVRERVNLEILRLPGRYLLVEAFCDTKDDVANLL
jgi:hypothetical protein